MKKSIRTTVALLAATVMCLASGMMRVIPVEAASEPCMHETIVVDTSVFKGYTDISESGHSELFERTYRCATCMKKMDGTVTVSISCSHSVVQYSDLGHYSSIAVHTYDTYCKCGYSHRVFIPCNGLVTGSHIHP